MAAGRSVLYPDPTSASVRAPLFQLHPLHITSLRLSLLNLFTAFLLGAFAVVFSLLLLLTLAFTCFHLLSLACYRDRTPNVKEEEAG